MAMSETNTSALHDNPEKAYIQTTGFEHRKKFAQFFTPSTVATFMSHWLLGSSNLKTVLDPAFGLGIFARTLHNITGDCHITGYDIDPHIIQQAYRFFGQDGDITIHEKDYLFCDWENKYDGIICNPPYFKFHDYDNKKAVETLQQQLGITVNRFTNQYALFLLKAIHQLNPNGRAAFIVPSEFLNADYGKWVKKHLLQQQSLRYVVIVDFEENVFDDALTTACILLFANDAYSSGTEFVTIKNPDELYRLQQRITSYPYVDRSKVIPFQQIDAGIKWRAYYQPQNAARFKHLVPFSKYGRVVRGIATGANDFFTFSLSKARQWNIDRQFLLPCINKSADVPGSFFTAPDFEQLARKNKTVFLLQATHTTNAAVDVYLQKGLTEAVDKRFLPSVRNPWYAMENRPPSPIWVSVFNRNGLRFVRNEAMASNLTTFHCIYLAPAAAGKADLLFAYLLTDMAAQLFNDNRREYGNGLQKFEPNDINNANMVDLDLINGQDLQAILDLYKAFRQTALDKKPDASLLAQMNGIFHNLFSL
jgi:adenine-specific DNA-methyltransferase